MNIQSIKEFYWGLKEVPGTVTTFLSPASLRARSRATVGNWKHGIVMVDDVKLRLGPHLSHQIRYTICMGDYELPERKMMRTQLDKNDIVFELGTGLGLISTICAARIGNDRVFTVEANPQLVPIIEETFALNGVKPHLINCMVGPKDGERAFYIMKEFWSSSTVRRSPKAQEVKVPERDCNRLLREIKPTFLVVDIEGGEIELFQYIDLTGIKKVSIELHERVTGHEAAQRVRDRLTNEGFRVIVEASAGREQLLLRRD